MSSRTPHLRITRNGISQIQTRSPFRPCAGIKVGEVWVSAWLVRDCRWEAVLIQIVPLELRRTNPYGDRETAYTSPIPHLSLPELERIARDDTYWRGGGPRIGVIERFRQVCGWPHDTLYGIKASWSLR